MGARTVSKALFLFAPAVLGLVLSLSGCTGCEERTDSGYPDRSFDTFCQLDEEVIAPGMSEEEVLTILGPPDRRTEFDRSAPVVRVLWYQIEPRPGVYWVYVSNGIVTYTMFEWGF